MKPDLQFDYTTVGHVAIDVLADGSRRAGGGAFYSALQAARLGRRTLVITQGVPREIEELIEPHRGELDVEILPAAQTTTLETSGSGAARRQRLLAWAGPIASGLTLDTAILHLAPIARESPTGWQGRAEFVGFTPQGMLRRWTGLGDHVWLQAAGAEAEALARRCDALVVSDRERAQAANLIFEAGGSGALVAVTAGEGPTTLLPGDGSGLALAVPGIASPRDDLGAGDVFAAALFIALTEGRAPRQAGEFANAAASLRIEVPGTGGIGDREAVEARLASAAERA